MQKHFILCLLAMVFSCQTKTENTASNKDLAKFFENYYEERLKFSPLEATTQGDNRYNDQLPIDISEDFRAKYKAFLEKQLGGIQQFNRGDLNANDRIAYDIFKREMEMGLEGLTFNDHLIPFQQFWGLPLTMGQLGSGESSQPFKTKKDYQDWLKRCAAFRVWGDTAIANFRKGMASGYVLPQSLVAKMIPQMKGMVSTDPTKHLFYSPINKLPKEWSDADKKSMTDAYKQAIMNDIVPTYQKLGEFLENEYLPKARSTSGILALPQGKEFYAYQVKYWTTTNKTPEEIYETGLKEVARIRTEMEKIKTEVGFKGTLNEFFQHLRSDPKMTPFRESEEVLDAFRSILAKIEPNLKTMFNKTPKSKFEIRRTEAFREASASAEYNQGSADGTRPGIFYVPIPDASKFNITSGMESLFLHEAIPGHHYQVSLQQENTQLHKFQRFNWYGAYGEGWALYTESLGKELGLYTNPYQYMGALGDEMHRAIRLVVDVGLHTKGWTREQAIKYMMDNEALDEAGVIAEIERYMAIPGQALSYKIGSLKIRELRSKYEKQQGEKFNLAAFHDEFLKDGCMPLEVLEQKMDAWAGK